MTTPTTTQPRRINQAIAVGTLEIQRRRGQDLTTIRIRNELQGRAEQAMLQILSPFGKTFALPLQIEGHIPGADLLASAQAGTPLLVHGELEWDFTTDPRYALNAGERGRRASELTFHATEIAIPDTAHEPGCDVWLEGMVQTPARIMPHPHKPSVRVALTNLRVRVTRQRQNSRAVMQATELVPLVIPLGHPDAPNLLRPGNQVIVEGMLERVVVALSGEEVERAQAALDARWEQQRKALAHTADDLRQAERYYRRQRMQLAEGTRSRVVAGYVELVEGTPANLREAYQLRHQFLQQRARRNRKGGTPSSREGS